MFDLTLIYPLALGSIQEAQSGVATFLKAILVLFGIISLGISIYRVIKGENESAKKMFVWFFCIAMAFVIIDFLGSAGGA